LLLCTRASSVAQTPGDSSSLLKGWGAEVTVGFGKIWKHTPNFQPEIEHASAAFELAIAKQLHGKKSWEYQQDYPSIGIAACLTNLGNNDVLGNAYSIMPFMEIPIFRSKKMGAIFRVGSGLAYITEHYDYLENPTNNVIASHGNNITQFSGTFRWEPSPYFAVGIGGSFTHYSTGAVRVPNLGINIPAARIGIRYTPVPLGKNDFITHKLFPPTKKILFQAQTGIGFKESYPSHGPMYHVFILELSAGKMISRSNKLSAGMMGTYKESSESFIKQQEIYEDNFFLNSCSLAGFVKDDFIFGFFGISLMAGYNFYQPSPLEFGFYQKVGIPFYFPSFGKEKNERFSAGVYVTAGEFTADFVSVETGFQF
jgi:hypothetical protein